MVQNGWIASDSCALALKVCDPDYFPNLYILLKIAATLRVTSCEFKHFHKHKEEVKQLRDVHHGREWALLAGCNAYQTHDLSVNLEEVVKLFEGLHPRMMQFTSLVYDWTDLRTWKTGMYIDLFKKLHFWKYLR